MKPDDPAYIAYRIRMLPEQLERARLRVAQLEREAISLNMEDLVYGQGKGSGGGVSVSRPQDDGAGAEA
jgi:hypothetical protein